MLDKFEPTQPLITVDHGDVEILVAPVQDFGLPVLGDVTRLSDEQVAKYPAFLNRFDPENAWKSNVLLAIAKKGSKLIAAVTGELVTAGDRAVMTVCNLVSDGSKKGIALPVLAALYRGALLWAGREIGLRAYARVMPDGRANVASTKTMMRIGVYAADLITHPITARNPQKALDDSAEPNNQELRYMLLVGDAEDVIKRVDEILP